MNEKDLDQDLDPNKDYESDDDIVTEEKNYEDNNESEETKQTDSQKKKFDFNNIVSGIREKLKSRQSENSEGKNLFQQQKIKIGIGIATLVVVGFSGYYAYVYFEAGEGEVDYNTENIVQNINQIPLSHNQRDKKVRQQPKPKVHSKPQPKYKEVKIIKPKVHSKPQPKQVDIVKKTAKVLPDIKEIKKEAINTKNDPIIKNIKDNITKIPNDIEKKDLMTLNSEKLIENKNYEQYLQSKIEVMQKLLLYYKKTAELKKALDVYKQVLNPNKGSNSTSGRNAQKQPSISPELKNTLIQLQNQIVNLKNEIKKEKKTQIDIQTPQRRLDITSMNVFAKDGKYIAVIKNPNGDRVLQVGDFYNGAKIVGITPTTITFQKGTQRYYYNTTTSFNAKYQTAKIKLPVTISTTSLKENIKDKKEIKEYKQETPQDRLQKLLEQRMKR